MAAAKVGEELHELGIELDAAVAPKLGDGLRVGDRGPVRATGDHGLVRVGDRHDARPDRDLLAGEAVGIAATVEPLVVVEHDRGRVAQRAGLFEDDLADLGVLGDDPPFGLVQFAGLGPGSPPGSRACRGRGGGSRRGCARAPFGQANGAAELGGGAGDHRRWLAGPAGPFAEGRGERLRGGAQRGPADLDRPFAGARRDGRPLDEPVVLDLVEDEDLVATEGLGAVQGVVGIADEGDQVEVPAEAAGDAGRQGHAHDAAVLEGEAAQGDEPAELLGKGGRRVHVRLGQDHQELLAAVAATMSTPRTLARRTSATAGIWSPATWPGCR